MGSMVGCRLDYGAVGNSSVADTMVSVGYLKSILREQKYTYLVNAQCLLAKLYQALKRRLSLYWSPTSGNVRE